MLFFLVQNVQNFVIIWLDSNFDELNEDCRNSITALRQICNIVNTFTDAVECIHFLTDIQDEKAILIVSGHLGQQIVPRIHDLAQLDCIYVFTANKSRHEQWAKDWSKVKGVFTEMTPICESLKHSAQECDHDCIAISFITAEEASSGNLDQLDPSFMYTQILKEILLVIDYDKGSVKDFTSYCRMVFADNIQELNNIERFEQEYHRRTPIWWYTAESFLYMMLNRALRILDADIIIKLGFFICDLHRQIEQLHFEQYLGHKHSFIVFRGQGLLIADFEKLMKSKGGLISFNTFLSTSLDRNVSLDFAKHVDRNSEMMGILFEIIIDPSVSTTPFARVDNVSSYQSEKEILFSMHTVFRVGQLQSLDGSNRLWQVKLTLTTDNDPELRLLTDRMREETRGTSGWDELGQLLIKMGQFNKAEEVYHVLLEKETHEIIKARCYHQLGYIKNCEGEYDKAIMYYEMSLIIKQETLPSDHSDFGTAYNNIGLVYKSMGEYCKALSYYQKSLEIQQKSLPPNHPSLATSYNNIGNVYYNMGEYSKALSCNEKALEIRQQTLPANHPDLATSYSNIGGIYNNMGEYSKALSCYEKDLEISQKTLPSNHPDLATSYNNIGNVYYYMGEYSKALSYNERALAIGQQSLPANHPFLATSYSNIASVYNDMGEYSKALLYFEKVLVIRESSLPANHPDLGALYNNIGFVYENLQDYSKAIVFYERALENGQHSLHPYHPNFEQLQKSLENVRQKL